MEADSVNGSRKESGNVRNMKLINGFYSLGCVHNIPNPRNHRCWGLGAKGFKYVRLAVPK